MKEILGIILCIVIIFAFIWVVQGNDFFMYKVFAPKYEQVRRETFEQSKAYNQGMVQDLERFYTQYNGASDSEKEAISSVVLHRFADYDDSKLPSYLQSFMNKLRDEKFGGVLK